MLGCTLLLHATSAASALIGYNFALSFQTNPMTPSTAMSIFASTYGQVAYMKIFDYSTDYLSAFANYGITVCTPQLEH